MGFPNELAATSMMTSAAGGGVGSGCTDAAPCRVALFFRLYIGEADYDPYGDDDPESVGGPSLVGWGNVPPPSITRETYDSSAWLSMGGRGVPLPIPLAATPLVQCPSSSGVAQRLYDAQRSKMMARNTFNGSSSDNTDDNFVLCTHGRCLAGMLMP